MLQFLAMATAAHALSDDAYALAHLLRTTGRVVGPMTVWSEDPEVLTILRVVERSVSPGVAIVGPPDETDGRCGVSVVRSD